MYLVIFSHPVLKFIFVVELSQAELAYYFPNSKGAANYHFSNTKGYSVSATLVN